MSGRWLQHQTHAHTTGAHIARSLTFLALLLDGTGRHTVIAAFQAQRTRTCIGLQVAIAPRALRVAAFWRASNTICMRLIHEYMRW